MRSGANKEKNWTDRQIPLCPFTNLPAKYRHPTTLIPFATKEGYQAIEALLRNRYEWVEPGGWWGVGEGDVVADGMGGVDGLEAGPGIGGWYAGERVDRLSRSEPREGQEQEHGHGQETTPADGQMEEKIGIKRARESQTATKSKRRR